MKFTRIIDSMLPQHIKRIVVSFYKQVSNFITLWSKYGQFRTISKWDCVDSLGNKIPWYTYPSIEYLSQFDYSNIAVLEYGSGNSSVWWANRCAYLVSIEDNYYWFQKVSHANRELKNFDCRFFKDRDCYCFQNELKTSGVIIIDGKWRHECAEKVVENIQDIATNCYLLIIDNSDWYPSTVKFIAEKLGWVQCDFMGFGPINRYCWATSVFVNPNRKLARAKAIHPIGGVENVCTDDEPVG